ncbi:MAG: hemerythrin domain-containing protein [Rhodospirillaceae bacterium]|nr:hemerythrin domain-containing protein [Rhodospirillaceae bacterium]
MPTSTHASTAKSRARASAAPDAIKLLRADHKEVSELFEAYEKLGERAQTKKAQIANKICKVLTVHAQIEEEIFYPEVRAAMDEDELLDEAEVEHGSIKDLVAEIERGLEGEIDGKFDAKVKVVSEWVKHHVKEEQNELFPKVRDSDIDLDALGECLKARKDELMG